MESNNQNQWVDVTQPPFNARGDGKSDDAPAIQRAVDFLHDQFGPRSREEQLHIPQDENQPYPD